MPVNLDSIQFYRGPSKPEKRPYLAFDSKESVLGPQSSTGQSIFPNNLVFSATEDRSTSNLPTIEVKAKAMTPDRSTPPPNWFDFEIAKCGDTTTPLPQSQDAGDRSASFLPGRLGDPHQRPLSTGVRNDCKFRHRTTLYRSLLIHLKYSVI